MSTPAATAASQSAKPLTAIELIEQEIGNFFRQREQAISNVHAVDGAIQAAQMLVAKLKAEAVKAENFAKAEAAKAEAEAKKLVGEAETEAKAEAAKAEAEAKKLVGEAETEAKAVETKVVDFVKKAESVL